MSQRNIFESREQSCPDSEVLLTETAGPHRNRYLSVTEHNSEQSLYTDKNASATPLCDQHAEDTPRSESRRLTPSSGLVQRLKGTTQVWGYIAFPLIAHFCLTIGILCMTLLGINNRVFNIIDRTPTMTLLDGTKAEIEDVKFNLLQSDITTILSLLLAILRLFSTAWCGALCWRTALILMEKSGMTTQELNRLASFGLPPIRFSSVRRRSGGGYMLALGIILIFILPVPLGAPLLTGSITWAPASVNYPAKNMTIRANGWGDYDYNNHSGIERSRSRGMSTADITDSAIRGFQTWGSSNETDIMRRTLTDPRALTLPINTILNNITVPYFKITKFEWLKDPDSSLTPRQLGAIDPNNNTYWLNVSQGSDNPMFNSLRHNAALVHDQDLSLRVPEGEGWPISHTAALVYLVDLFLIPSDNNTKCRWSRYYFDPPFINQPDVTLVQRQKGTTQFCFALANITYTAGSASCSSCRISSPLIAQSDAPLLQVNTDDTTRYIMYIMAEVAIHIRQLQFSATLPQSKWNTLDQYLTSQLQQTYSASWDTMTELRGLDKRTDISLPVSVLRGLVDTKRVWAWFALQMIITLSGVAFIVIQAHVDQSPIQNVTLVPLFINASGINANDGSLHTMVSNEGKGVLRLRRVQGELLSQASYVRSDST